MRAETAEFVRAAHRPEDLLSDGRDQVAFVGRSNVGKSSLMNRLLGRKGLARESSSPGRTRSINYFLINRRFYFVDLPGYGYAKVGRGERQRWAGLVDEYLRRASPDLGVVLIVDARVGPTELDIQAYDYLRGYRCKITIVATKIDRLARSRREAALAAVAASLPPAQPIPVSARTGEGIRELWREITPTR